MWYSKYIRGENFISYEALQFEFLTGKTTLLYGINMDEPGADSNGSGKSAIVKGVTIALLDMPDKSLAKEEYIKDGADFAYLEYHLENPTFSKTLTIQRTIHRKKESTISLIEDGIPNDKLTSVNEGNKRILTLLDISKDDLLNYYIINQDNSNSFFESTDTAQKSTISRFANADPVNKAIELVQKDISDKNEEIQSIEGKVTIIDTRVVTLQEQIQYERDERVSDLESEKKKYNEGIESLNETINKCIENITIYKDKLKKFNKSIKELELPEESEVDELESRLSKQKTKVKEYNASVKELSKAIADIDKILVGEIKCPKCGHKWLEDADSDLKSLEKSHKEFEDMLKTVEEMSKKTENRIEELTSRKDTIDTLSDQYEELKQEISRCGRKIDSLNKEIEDSKLDINKYKESIKKLSKGADNNRISTLESEIMELDEKKSDFTEEISKLNKEKEELVYWNINLGIKGFKTFLVNKILNNLEGYVNLFLTKFSTNLIVRIQGFKTLKSGEVRENITVTISRDGGDTWKPFKRHSGGQRGRINVCGILTLQTLINNSSKYGGNDLLILDEFFEGLDQRGQRGVLKILNNTNITTLVISHNNNDIVDAENQVYVRYKDGVSKIISKKLYEKIKSGEDRQDKTISISQKER